MKKQEQIYSDDIRITDYPVNIYAVDDGWIYFTGNGIHKMREDGSEKTKINNRSSRSFDINEDWIYFRGVVDNEEQNNERVFSLFKMRKDGSNETKIKNTENAEIFSVIGDWVYYRVQISPADCGKRISKLFRVNINNGVEEKITME